ncbi:MAG: XRE family transcriptional regulator [Chitinophagia bacterium]|jgi:transcriptional regulator with XRE-family HTH domain|nr:XRE family transcriptional regulator [Chitinophagia bacterium]
MYSNASTAGVKPVALELGQRIRKARLQKDLTIQALADLVGIEYTQMSRIELGKINTSVLQVCKISRALEVCMSTLLKDLELNVGKKEIDECGPEMLFSDLSNG